jgi:hypothetical protein
MKVVDWDFYENSCIQSPLVGLSSALIHVLAVVSCSANTTRAAANPMPDRTFDNPSVSSLSSSSSACIVAICGDAENEVPRGRVGAGNCTVAFGRAIVGGAPPPGRIAPVGAAEARRMVGAGDIAGAPAVRRGTVGAGADGRGGPLVGVGGGPLVGVGGAPGTGGRLGGAMCTVAEGTEGGASAAFKVTRTVSFFRGTLDVCLDGDNG